MYLKQAMFEKEKLKVRMRRKAWRPLILGVWGFWGSDEMKYARRRQNMDKREKEKVEEYFVEALDCLLDVRLALDGAKLGASIEKGDLIRVGRDFGYQQGIIDLCDELARYASGEVSLKEAIEDLMAAKKKMVEEEMQAPAPSGMEVG